MNNVQTEELLKLIRENPTLPIVPFVDSEICEDGDGYWMGSFKSCSVEEYTTYDGRYFTDRGYLKEVYLENDEDIPEGLSEEAVDELFEKHTWYWWKKAIIVYIGFPEIEERN